MRIVHVLRAPVGGLFRHVVDLAGEQIKAGHDVGIIADAATGGTRAEAMLKALEPRLALGIVRVAMARQIGISDVSAWRTIKHHLATLNAEVVHGHGAKGGAYARLAAPEGALRVYTPHGGSLHYKRGTLMGTIYLNLEDVLAKRTDLFLFESDYSRRRFIEAVCDPGARARVAHNGVSDEEFAPVALDADATDLLFIGELRDLKGVDVLIDALGLLKAQGRPVTATIVGAGPDEAAFKARTGAAGLDDLIRFPGAMPAREAMQRGRVLVVPSRAESLPYVIMEGAAAGRPVIATQVGGIGEIFGPQSGELVPAGDAGALARRIAAVLDGEADAEQLRARVREMFSLSTMGRSILAAYGAARA